MITDQMAADWRANYGLKTRTPQEAAQWWNDNLGGKAPAGAVAAVGLLLQERERHAKQRQRWADKCDDLADHADDHTRASLREMAAEMRTNAEPTGPRVGHWSDE